MSGNSGEVEDRDMKNFKTQLTSRGPGGAWTFLEVPFSVAEAWGTKARIAVTGTMNGFAFQNSLMPNGDGTHSMMVSKALQAGAKAAAGDVVSVTMDVDRSERVVSVPVELKRALATDKTAAATFKTLSYSHRKEFADWIAGAKQEETRLRRAKKAISMVLAREHVR
jgi:phospholipase C